MSEENKAELREAKLRGKNSGFKAGVVFTLLSTAAAAIALNKAGVNVTDKATGAFDKTVEVSKKAIANTKKKLEEKKEN